MSDPRMSSCTPRSLAVGLFALSLVAGSAGAQSLELVATQPVADFDVPTTQTVAIPLAFAGVARPVTGVGISALYTGVRRDNEDGLGPWSLDVELKAIAPDASMLSWNPIGGDVTIADYPLQDGTGGLPSVDANGNWSFEFSSDTPSSVWIYGLRNVELHLLADAPTMVDTFMATPDVARSWNRPFFIAGTSGLGPVAYHVFEFTVTVSGVYEFESVLSNSSDHFTFLYQGGFDDSQPLTNLLDYGLGNGNSPFNVPRGTSRISALLHAGTTYHWITSQWSRFAAIAPSTNTVSGPGLPVEPGPACTGDIADDFGTLNGGDAMVSFGDFLALLGLIGPCNGGDPGCPGDIADDFGTLNGGDGMVSFGDFLALLGLIGPCP